MLDERHFKSIAAEAGRQLGAVGGEQARAAFFLDMLTKWLWMQKDDLLEITGDGIDIHAIDECAMKFCEYIGDKGPSGYRYEENPTRFAPTLKELARDQIKVYIQ